MARGTTLEKLLDQYRAECRLSLNSAHNQQDREAQVNHIQRVQAELWENFNWPHMRVRRELLCQAGQRYYDVPEDLSIDRLEMVEFRSDGVWRRLRTNITAGEYATVDSDLDQRSWPIVSWQLYEGEQVEVWPIANANGNPDTIDGTLRFTGIRNLAALVDDDDRADLDDKCIILYCAAERLSATGAKDAQYKLDKANARLAKLRGDLMPRRQFNMFGANQTRFFTERRNYRPYVTYRPPGT